MSKNSIYINKKTDEALNQVAKTKGLTKSAVINSLVEQVGLGREDVKPIVLLIPAELLKDQTDQLLIWLASRTEGIHRYFYPNE